jgi:hypothetical protein
MDVVLGHVNDPEGGNFVFVVNEQREGGFSQFVVGEVEIGGGSEGIHDGLQTGIGELVEAEF